MQAPSAGVLASSLEVGSSVYLMENGVAAEYLVVNQGIPGGSSLYDSSCDGTWLLRKNCYTTNVWLSSVGPANRYDQSAIRDYLSNTYLNLLGETEQQLIKEVTLPFAYGGTVFNSTEKVFLLSVYEVGWIKNSSLPDIIEDGGCLSYFADLPIMSDTRIAYLNNTITTWWLRSTVQGDYYGAGAVTTVGNYTTETVNDLFGVRPALILPTTAKFDKNTMILKG